VNAIVGNDACWSQIARDQVPFFNTRVACDLAVSVQTINASIINCTYVVFHLFRKQILLFHREYRGKNVIMLTILCI
jgi:hypothetical protein